ncbi:hypothetical protein CR158_16035 [Halomonas heilongjiangensis]|uniref:Uncharacterized protein n=1 Tax=Halomonas heilongjiangensis TaxID=1387883 RepID=A0A2N7TFZ4_9GAMM|nr:hypothetical protein C1H66_20770 [Halomonas heilongjiangensis]PXX87852.1 hypothetical protein CR158_16035 [Halomonas heilongjiangensis]
MLFVFPLAAWGVLYLGALDFRWRMFAKGPRWAWGGVAIATVGLAVLWMATAVVLIVLGW